MSDFQITCAKHKGADAAWECQGCHKWFCNGCMREQDDAGLPGVCPECGAICTGTEKHKDLSFAEMIQDSFMYPLRGKGMIYIVFGVILFYGFEILRKTRGYTHRGNLVGAVLAGFLVNIIYSSAKGDKEVPELPGVKELQDNYDYNSTIFFLFSLAFSFAPFIVYYFAMPGDTYKGTALYYLFLGLGMLYAPMAMLSAGLGMPYGMYPHKMISAIIKTFHQYFVAVILGGVLIFALFVWPDVIYTDDSIIDLLARQALTFYLFIVEFRILGLIYYINKDELNWVVL